MDQKRKKLQYVSDIHLEFRVSQPVPIIQPIEPGNTYLALCGDIGNPYLSNYQEFLDIHSKLFEHILLVAGNHEYYNLDNNQNTIIQVDNYISNIVKNYDNVTYLNKNKFIIGKTKFIGCTLWTDVAKIQTVAEMAMNDYRSIFVESNCAYERLTETHKIIKPYKSLLSSDNVIGMHRQMKKWLSQEINSSDNTTDIIVLSHHAPTFKMLPKIDIYSDCYASNCENIIKSPVKFWLSGHTHACMKYDMNGIIFLSNCMGYPYQNILDYDNKWIEFD
jgi:predicted MPP superfamily phosphohydrolase